MKPYETHHSYVDIRSKSSDTLFWCSYGYWIQWRKPNPLSHAKANWAGNTFPAKNAIFQAKMPSIAEHGAAEGTLVESSFWSRKKYLHVIYIELGSSVSPTCPKMIHKKSDQPQNLQSFWKTFVIFQDHQ